MALGGAKLLSILFLAAGTVNSTSTEPAPLQTRIIYKINPDTVIGPVRAGTVCLPNGKLRWDDLRLPGALDGEALVAGTLARSGIKGGVVELTIEAVRLRLCMPGLPGVFGKPKGEGSISMRWQLTDSDGNALGAPFVSDVPLSVDGRDPRRSSLMIEHSLAVGSEEFVRYWHSR